MKSLRPMGLLIVLIAAAAGIADGQKKNKPGRPVPGVSPTIAVKTKCETNGLTSAEIADLVAAHNRARAEQKLPAMVWDCMLANLAQRWANRGIFEHRGDTSYGENIFVSSNPGEPVGTVVKTWLGERTNWTNQPGVCSPGKVCSHYTQVMWHTTVLVGCGINRSSPGTWKTLVVCNYSPVGNTGGPAY